MAELTPIHGKSRFLLFRLLKDAKTKTAAKLALQTEHEWSYERDVEQTKTKDGSIPSSGALEVNWISKQSLATTKSTRC